MDHPPETTGPPHRRGPSVDLDPSGIVTGKSPDRQRRQFLNYSFYRLDGVFRTPCRRAALGSDWFIELVRKWESLDEVILRTHLARGPARRRRLHALADRGDPMCFQSMEAQIRRSRLGAYLSQVQLPLAAAPVAVRQQDEGLGRASNCCRGKANTCSCAFTKTRSWYRLSPHARQGMMDEHIAASAPFKGVRLNTSNSYGIDDQDFVVAFDSDYPQEFVDLVGRLRYTEASLYTQRTRRCSRVRRHPLTRSSRSWRRRINDSRLIPRWNLRPRTECDDRQGSGC